MTTDFQKIFDLVENIDISNYSKNRNFIDGSVTKLSPYISRGVISTKFILESLKKRNINLKINLLELILLQTKELKKILYLKKLMQSNI